MHKTIEQAIKVAGPQREASTRQYRRAEAEAIQDGRAGGCIMRWAEAAAEKEAEEEGGEGGGEVEECSRGGGGEGVGGEGE